MKKTLEIILWVLLAVLAIGLLLIDFVWVRSIIKDNSLIEFGFWLAANASFGALLVLKAYEYYEEKE